MEFILHLPQEINKDGTLWQTWDSFYKKCLLYQSTELHRDSVGDSSSLLLFAGSHHVNSICSSLKVYNLNLEKLTKVLHIVEQVCLPYFILLFERFRYFSLKQDMSNNLDDNSVVLQKQVEICEFINLKDSIGTNVVGSSQKTESQDQSVSNAEKLCYNKLDYNGSEKSHGSNRDDNPVRFETLTSNVGLEMFDQSGSSSSQDGDLSTSVAFNSHSVSADSSFLHPEKDNALSAGKKNVGGQSPGVQNKWNVERKNKFNKFMKIKDVCFEKIDKGLAVTSLEKDDWNSESAVACTSEMGEDSNKMSAPLTSTVEARENFKLKQFQCCQCSSVFAGQNCFKKHLLTKHKDCSEFICGVCTATYADAEKYAMHYTNTHTVEQRMQAARRGPAVRIKAKRDVKNFQCTICGKVFRKKGYLNNHINYNHKRSFLCWHCGEEFPSSTDYKQHSEKHVINGRFVCDLCQRPYSNVFRLVGHLKNHLQPQNKCGICGFIYRRQESLAKHVEKHTEEPDHMCKICGKLFVCQRRLQCHMETHSREKRFTCELCGKTYAQKANLKHHRRWHTGEQPYECEICGKRTRSLGELSKHKRMHSDKYFYVCEICGRGFSYSSSLLDHRLGHTGKRSYACDVCGRTYIYREGLRAHMKASRCTGRAEAGMKRKPRATKLSLSGVPVTKVDELKVFKQVHQSTDTGLTL